MRIQDISVPMGPLEPGDPGLLISGSCGTQLYCPGEVTAGDLRLEQVVGPCHVLDFAHLGRAAGWEDLASYPRWAEAPRVLLRTRGEEPSPVVEALDETGADFLEERGALVVGFDSPIDPEAPLPARLLRDGAVLLAGLDLRWAAPGRYILVALPLKVEGLGASPVRAVLLEGPGFHRDVIHGANQMPVPLERKRASSDG